MPAFGGRTDLDLCAETLRSHGVTDCPPERFFARYVEAVLTTRHEFALQGALMPGVREGLARLGGGPAGGERLGAGHGPPGAGGQGDPVRAPAVVQTLVTGNVPQVAAAKVHAFGLSAAFDTEVGGYGTDDHERATLVRRSRERAEAKYADTFRLVVIGDTVNDVTAALANGAT